MDRALTADVIINLCGTIGLVVAILVFRARDPRGALTRRFTFALGLVALVFAFRGLSWLGGSFWLDRLAIVFSAFIPLVALLVVEGMLRRHAPRWAKLAAVAGGGVLAFVALLAPHAAGNGLYLALALFQLAAFAVSGLLLLTYPRGSLSAPEERSVARLCLAAFVLLPFLITDFRSLLPGIPVRLGALGALIIIVFALLVDRAGETRGGHAWIVGLRMAGGILLGLAAALTVPAVQPDDLVRLMAVTLGGVLVIGLVVDVLRARFSIGRPGLLGSVARSQARTRDGLLEELLRQPLFESAIRLREIDLADYDPSLLRPALAGRIVLRAADHPWADALDAPAMERLAALLASHGASHLIVAGADPLDLVLVRVPLVASDRATETALLMAGRLLAAAPERHA